MPWFVNYTIATAMCITRLGMLGCGKLCQVTRMYFGSGASDWSSTSGSAPLVSDTPVWGWDQHHTWGNGNQIWITHNRPNSHIYNGCT